MLEERVRQQSIPVIARQLAVSSHPGSSHIPATEIKVGSDTYVVRKDAFEFLDSEWHKSLDTYDLQAVGTQKAIAQITLLALGIEAAAAKKGRIIGRPEIISGWEGLKVCGVGEHPHQCLGKAIVERQGQFLTADGMVGSVVRNAVRELDVRVDIVEQDVPKSLAEK